MSRLLSQEIVKTESGLKAFHEYDREIIPKKVADKEWYFPCGFLVKNVSANVLVNLAKTIVSLECQTEMRRHFRLLRFLNYMDD